MISQERIGLIAGNGKFPVLFAKKAKEQGVEVTAICFKEETSRDISKFADKVIWTNLGSLQRLFEIFEQEKLEHAVMAGQVKPMHLFRRIKVDEELRLFLEHLKDKRADSVFSALAKRLEENGVTLLDSSLYMEEFMPLAGVLTKCRPSEAQINDIEFGIKIATHVAGFDIGQTVAVKQGAVLAVEAFEGTDRTIRRAGLLGRGGIVVVKAAKPNQDMRFDIPLVGMRTIKTIIKSGGGCLAVQAKKTLFLDMDQMITLADKAGIPIVAF